MSSATVTFPHRHVYNPPSMITDDLRKKSALNYNSLMFPFVSYSFYVRMTRILLHDS